MIQIQNILCPVDLTPAASAAIQHAIAVAGWYEAKLHALHVFPPPVAMGRTFPIHSESMLDLQARTGLIKALDASMKPARGAGLDVKIGVEEGDVAREIVRVAGSTTADLIVMATHGRGGLEKFVLGSVTEKVLRTAPCPVLTIPPASGDPPGGPGPVYRRILCAVDFSEESMQALDYALSMAQEAGGKVTLLHVLEWFANDEVNAYKRLNVVDHRSEVEAKSRARLKDAVRPEVRDWCEPSEMVCFGKPYAQIVRVASEQSTDLVVLGVRGRGGVDLAVFGSTANRVVREAACPVLTVHAR